jgi:hypothetical protein
MAASLLACVAYCFLFLSSSPIIFAEALSLSLGFDDAAAAAAGDVSPAELFALQDLYQSTGGGPLGTWRQQTGWNGKNESQRNAPCAWFGVVCAPSPSFTFQMENHAALSVEPTATSSLYAFSVVGLNLSANGLQGTLLQFLEFTDVGAGQQRLVGCAVGGRIAPVVGGN